jgi:predicted amidophosphoribosyltransferase
MPDHRSTLYQKGGFPIGMLAKEIAHCLNWPLDLTSVIKHRATKSQKSCDQHDRAHNVEGAFLYQGQHSETDCLLILDDVITTGHSMHAMAMAIHEIRPIRLYGLCLTRAVYTSL